MRFNIGDVVWLAETRSIEKVLPCPDCFGKRYVTVILGDDSRVTVQCENCRSGYDPSRGYVVSFNYEEVVEEVEIIGVSSEMTPDGRRNRYQTKDRYYIEEERLSSTREEAEHSARLLAGARKNEDERRNLAKYKSNRNWAWNATYHRREIRNLRKSLERHEAALNYALVASKGREE